MVLYWRMSSVISWVIFTLAPPQLSAAWRESSVCLVRCESCFQAWERSRELIPNPLENGDTGIRIGRVPCSALHAL